MNVLTPYQRLNFYHQGVVDFDYLLINVRSIAIVLWQYEDDRLHDLVDLLHLYSYHDLFLIYFDCGVLQLQDRINHDSYLTIHVSFHLSLRNSCCSIIVYLLLYYYQDFSILHFQHLQKCVVLYFKGRVYPLNWQHQHES